MNGDFVVVPKRHHPVVLGGERHEHVRGDLCFRNRAVAQNLGSAHNHFVRQLHDATFPAPHGAISVFSDEAFRSAFRPSSVRLLNRRRFCVNPPLTIASRE